MSNIGKLLTAAACVAVGALVAMGLSSHSPTSDLSELQPSGPNALVRITPQRIPLAASISARCVAATPDYGPHKVAEVHIYANKRALDYRRNHPREYVYPIGSKFVKEKYSQAGDANPDVATIMERRATKGDVSDWNFSIVSLQDKTPLKATDQVACAECHEAYKDTGYVSSDSEFALNKYLKIK